jgi:hypothetical protein
MTMDPNLANQALSSDSYYNVDSVPDWIVWPSEGGKGYAFWW